MRLFIAVDLPIELKKILMSLQSKLKEYVYGNFVSEENAHITMKFLGEVDDSKVDKIKSLCKEASSEFKSFKANLQRLGVFPNENYIRVIWVGIYDGKDTLEEIYKKIDAKLAPLGFKDKHGFSGHITLARVKNVKDKENLIKFISENKTKDFGSFDVKEIKLMKSTLTRTGSEYEEIGKFFF